MAMTLRLDDADNNLLRALALTGHKSANQVVVDLIRAEFDRAFPGRRDCAANTTPEQRQAALLAALGLTDPPVPDPAAEADLDAAIAKAEAEADRIYGDAGQAAA